MVSLMKETQCSDVVKRGGRTVVFSAVSFGSISFSRVQFSSEMATRPSEK